MNAENVKLKLNCQLDKDRMVKRARHIFKHELQTYLDLSGRHRLELSSPRLDITGVSSHGGTNHTEDQFDLGVAAGYCVDAINDTLHDLSPLNFKILLYKYIYETPYHEHLKDWQVMNKIGRSGGNYFRILDNALFQFAIRLNYWGKKDHAELPETIFYLDDETSKSADES